LNQIKTYFGITKGGLPDLARAELASLFRTYGCTSIQFDKNSLLVVAHSNKQPAQVIDRAVLTKYLAEQLEEGEYSSRFSGKTFSCVVCGEDKDSFLDTVVRKIKQSSGAKVRLEGPDTNVIIVPEKKLVGIRIMPRRRSKFHKVPLNQKINHPSFLEPKFSRIMINLAEVCENELILDPFCGTGGILLEAEDMMINSLGLDIQPQMCYASKQNGLKNIICCNSLAMPVKANLVRAIVTDIPYGKSTYLLPNLTPDHLLFEAIKSYGDIVDRIVIMGRSVDVEKLLSTSFDMRCKIYYSYVHKSLTRCIMVVYSK
jgi:tRNA G10  N-methylase Trm11